MIDLFEDYDSFCDEIYKQFKYDIRGGETEYKILGYMVFVAVRNAYAEQVSQLDTINSNMDTYVTQFDSICTETRKALLTSVKMLAEALDKKYHEVSTLRDEIKTDVLRMAEKELSLMAGNILKREINKNGITLNQELATTIKELQQASSNAVSKAESIGNSIRKSLGTSFVRLFLMPLLGTVVGIIAVLVMQSFGIIALPVQVNIDAVKFSQHILSHLR